MRMNIKNLTMMVWKVIPYVFQAAPLTFVSIKVVAVIYALLWFARIPSNQYMIDTVADAMKGDATIQQIMVSILLVLLILVLGHGLNGLNAYNNMHQYYKVFGYMNYKINEKINKMPAIDFEDTKKLEQIEKAKNGSQSAMLLENIFHNLAFFYIPFLFFYGCYFYQINPILIWVIILIFLPQIISSFFQSKYHIDLEKELSPLRRKLEKYKECIIGKETFKDTRNLCAYPYFFTLYQETQRLYHKKRIDVERKVAFLRLYLTVFTLLAYILVIILLIQTLSQGDISIGAFSATFMSLSSLINISKEIAFGSFSNLSDNFGNITNFVTFMEEKPVDTMEDVNLDYSQGIIVHDISFQYPNTSKKAIDGVELKICPGETITIVGENGSGKSTLAKLLLGIYQPQEGNIIIGNTVNHRGNAFISHRNTTAVFQNFTKLALTIKDNITISDVRKKEKIEKYLEQVHVSLDSNQFTQGQDTMLAKEYGGIELSGGQWQRLAIARGLYRDHDYIVLDEPTAAIDPLEEGRIFQLIQEISKDKIAVIITHRLATVKFANRILVLDQGKLVEEGSHEDLIRLQGKYYHMYHEQAKWYER